MSDSETGLREKILAAAVETASINGINRLSMGDVARRAGLSRQTVYRYFASRDVLISEVVVSETAALIGRVINASRPHADPRASLEAAMLEALRATRDHPLLDRLVRTEPEALLPLLTTDGGPVMTQVRRVVESIIGERTTDGATDPADQTGSTAQLELDAVHLRRFADIVTRLFISYAVSAPDDPPEVVAASIAHFLFDGAASHLDHTSGYAPLEPEHR